MLAGANLCWDQLPICIKAQIYVLTDSVSKKLTGKYIQFFFTPFQNFVDLYMKNDTFSWFREFAPPIEKIPLFAKMGSSITVQFGREWRDRGNHQHQQLTRLNPRASDKGRDLGSKLPWVPWHTVPTCVASIFASGGNIWVRSRNFGCLVTWFCYQLIAKPGNKTTTVSWPDPYDNI